jgi:hypothetical protein
MHSQNLGMGIRSRDLRKYNESGVKWRPPE